MADLQQALKDQNAQLYQTSPEELQTLKAKTAKAGLPAAPISPLGVAALGANADQAKMAGASAQKITALRDSTQANAGQQAGANDLATALRVGAQPSGIPTAAEQKEQAQGTKLEGLSSLESRVGDLKNAALGQAASVSPAAAAVFDTTKVTQNPALATALQALNNNPNDIQALNNAYSAAGVNSIQQLQSQFGVDQGAQAGQMVAGAVKIPTVSSMSPDQIKSIGFSDINDLASTLGLPAEQIAGMTLSQLAESAKQVIQTQFASTQQLQATANDQYAGAAARQAANAALRESGATGIRSTESQLGNVANQLVNATQVTFGGQPMSIEQALSSPEISKWAATYANATQADKQAMAAQEPNLAALIDKNEGLIQQASTQLGATGTQYSNIQTQRQAIGNLGNGVTIPSDLLDKLVPGWSGAGTTIPDIGQASPLLASLKSNTNFSPEEGQTAVGLLQSTAATSPETFKALNGMSASKLHDLGLTTPGPQLNNFNRNLQAEQTFKSVLAKGKANVTQDDLAQVLGFKSGKDMGDTMSKALIMQNSGLFKGEDSGLAQLSKVVRYTKDANGNKVIDTVGTLTNLEGALPISNNIAGLASDNLPTSAVLKLGSYVAQNFTPPPIVTPAAAPVAPVPTKTATTTLGTPALRTDFQTPDTGTTLQQKLNATPVAPAAVAPSALPNFVH